MKVFVGRIAPTLLFVICATLVPSLGRAQAIGIYQDERAVTAIGNPTYEDYRNGNGVYYESGSPYASPTSYTHSHDASSDDGAYADITQQVNGSYGNLSLATTGASHSSAGYGDFVWSSTFIGGDQVVGFYDYITASQNMSIDFKYQLNGICTSTGNAYSNVTYQYSFANLGSSGENALNGSELLEGTANLSAGQQYRLFVALGWDCDADSNNLNSTSASFAMSAAGTVTLTSLTPGATFQSQSGYGYNAVPEPTTVLPLAVGVFALRRRRRQ